MGIFDAIRGLLGGSGVQDVLESTGLSEHVEGALDQGTALAENIGIDLGQATEVLGVDGVAESLPDGLGDIVQGAAEGDLNPPTV
jgi:hypothetical protein